MRIQNHLLLLMALSSALAALACTGGRPPDDRRVGIHDERVEWREPLILDFLQSVGSCSTSTLRPIGWMFNWSNSFIGAHRFSSSPTSGRPGFSTITLYDQRADIDVRGDSYKAQSDSLLTALDQLAQRTTVDDPPMVGGGPFRHDLPRDSVQFRRQQALAAFCQIFAEVQRDAQDRATFEWATWHRRGLEWAALERPPATTDSRYLATRDRWEARVRELRLKKFGVEE